MIGKIFNKLVIRFGIWTTIHGIIIICFGSMLFGGIIQLAIPLQNPVAINSIHNSNGEANTQNVSSSEKSAEIPYRPAMFKAATGIQAKPAVDGTVRRILDQLRLQCVLLMNGEPVAYINIQGRGLRKCHIGDNIADLFTVLDINIEDRKVEISIIDHKVTLEM